MKLASAYDLRQYCKRFESIFRRVLRPDVNLDSVAIVSRVEGALVFFTFKKKEQGSFNYRIIDEPIAKALRKLPQRGFGGDLSGVRFMGKNVIVGGNKLIIIKGDNSRISWSPEEATKDAIEEVRRISRF